MSKLKAKPPGETSPGKTKQLIFGPSGVGKTWYALSYPNPYYMDTEGGADLAQREQAAKLIAEMPCLKEANLIPVEDAEGWSEFQMWDLFSRFEGHIHNGAKPCFETTIELQTP